VKPEEKARQDIDKLLNLAGWKVQDYNELNLGASPGVAVREFPLQHGLGVEKSAIVVPDNVLFEGGAGETVRKKLFAECDVHTLLRLPTGVFYAQGVKANVLFFARKEAREKPWTERLWIYDLRTNKHFTLKTNPLHYDDLRDFIKCYNPKNRFERKETDRFKSFPYAELMQRDKVSLDISWLKDESLEDSENLPSPDLIAAEIVENLESALEQFSGIYEGLGQVNSNS